MMADYWAYHYAENPSAQDEVVDDDFDLQEELARLEREAEGADDWEDVAL